jgi:TIR domain/Ras of Complex, Roc, domain of DAPkinase/WD domain, G-beta repeat
LDHRLGPSGTDNASGFDGLPGEARAIGWSANGVHIAAATPAGAFVWSGQAAPLRLADPGPLVDVRALAWHPNDQVLATASADGAVWLWDADAGTSRLLCRLELALTSIAWAPSGLRLAVSDEQGAVRVLDRRTGESLAYRRVHQSSVSRLCWSPNGEVLVTCGRDGIIAGLDSDTLQWRHENRDLGPVRDIAVSPDDFLIASTSDDNSVHIWNLFSGRLDTVLEGHHDLVSSVCFSPGREFLASASATEVRLWRLRDWECVETIPSRCGPEAALAFHPSEPVLASKNEELSRIECHRFDRAVLGRLAVQYDSRRYVNAKIVLVGDSGVGKSGLGLVLSGNAYRPTDSTHGRHIWLFEAYETDVPGSGPQTREIWLWDLAGQPGYRLVHQLHLHEVAVALVVFDSRSETDPFVGVKYWVRALSQARRLEDQGSPFQKTFLVAARADRQGVATTDHRVQALVDELELDGFFVTSARESWQIPELGRAIRESIDWNVLPMVSSSALFDSIKQFLLAEKSQGRSLSTSDDLFHSFLRTRGNNNADSQNLRASFETCIGLLESQGLIRRLRFGDFVLLKPELLDSYASAIIQAAKDEPDGLGFIGEKEALDGQFVLPESERIGDPASERLLLIATAEELLRHEIALRETTESGVDLVFPSQFTRERPGAPDIPGKEVVFTFEGALHNIYATLAVRLCHSRLFQKQAMWEDAAAFTATGGGTCGLHLRELEEGRGELSLFYDAFTSPAVRIQFEAYIFEYLQYRAIRGTVSRSRILICPMCGYAVPLDLVQRRLAMGKTTLACPACEDAVISLLEGASAADAGSAVTEMNKSADLRRDLNVAATQLQGKLETGDYDVFLSYNSSDRKAVVAIGERLKEHGILPWLDVWEIRPGTRWQPELSKQLRKVKSAAVFVGPHGAGPWQELEVEEFLTDFARRKRPIIPVILEGRKGRPRLPPFLNSRHIVDMRQSVPDPFEQIVWGITGENRSAP